MTLMHQRLLGSTALMAAAGDGGQQQQQQQQQQPADQQQQQQKPADQQQQQQNNQQQQKPADQQQQVAAYRPEGLPDHLFGTTDKETVDKLFKAVDGFRRGESDYGVLPKTPGEYKLDFGDKVKPFAANFDKDPLFKDTLKYAHEAGIRDKQLNKFLPKLLEHMVETGMVPVPVDATAELLKLTPPEAANLDDAGKATAAAKRLNDNIAWVDGFKAQKVLPEKVADWLAAETADKVEANQFVEWLRGNDKEVRPALDGGRPPAGGADAAAVNARLTDPRNDPRHSKFEPAFAAETDRLSKLAWPG